MRKVISDRAKMKQIKRSTRRRWMEGNRQGYICLSLLVAEGVMGQGGGRFMDMSTSPPLVRTTQGAANQGGVSGLRRERASEGGRPMSSRPLSPSRQLVSPVACRRSPFLLLCPYDFVCQEGGERGGRKGRREGWPTAARWAWCDRFNLLPLSTNDMHHRSKDSSLWWRCTLVAPTMFVLFSLAVLISTDRIKENNGSTTNDRRRRHIQN